MKYKLDNLKTTDLSTLKNNIETGSRFVVFIYRIGLGFVSLQRFSPAIFVQQNNEIDFFKKKYNRLNLLFGPWFLFKGPFLAYSAYKTNKKGGIDVTNDIMLNLTSDDLMVKEVDIKEMYNLFSKVEKLEKKEIHKTIKELNKNLVPVENVYVAQFINVDENEHPFTVIGLKVSGDEALTVKYIEEKLYKRFYKHTVFKIVDLRGHNDYNSKLIEQGELIYGN